MQATYDVHFPIRLDLASGKPCNSQAWINTLFSMALNPILQCVLPWDSQKSRVVNISLTVYAPRRALGTPPARTIEGYAWTNIPP
ncbi:hypothetical protein [Pontixanthobacter gangjinensis]|uniref:Uncharacterized protein n=1 Tax=Pontixanthobacter gangjinensis TaxID=1028742 RepID=A0A6I4SNG1_9SPHN|nr:hypothetical protein [Pontixanthobacter gangjinensis]MXO56680.1 hypothetical protein [Pontixanthobacter gangjinensis]